MNLYKKLDQFVSKAVHNQEILVPDNDSIGESKIPQAQYSHEEMRDHIEKYKRLGLSFIPISPENKKGALQWKQYQTTKPTSAEIEHWYQNYWKHRYNIGIVCGESSNGMIALDFDDPVKFYIARAYGISKLGIDLIDKTPVVRSSRGYHVWIKVKNLDRSKFKNLNAIDIQSARHIAVAPPSIHKTGIKYKFLNSDVQDILTINSLSDLGIDNCGLSFATQVTKTDIINSIEGVAEHQRNNACFDLAVYFRDLPLPKPITLNILEDWALRCTPKLDLREARGCVESAYSYQVDTGINEECNTVSSDYRFRVADDIVNNAPDLKPLWRDILFPDSIVLFSGTTGIGKTTFLYDLFLALSNGREFAGMKPVKPLKVLYIDAESGDSLIKTRIQRIDPGQHKNLLFGEPFDVMNNASIIQAIKEQGVDVMVIDTISMAIQTESEDSNAEASNQMRKLREIISQTGVCIIMVHHLGKNPNAKGIHRGRGASARPANADIVINFEGNDDTVTLDVVKTRLGMNKSSLKFKKTNSRFVIQNGITKGLLDSSNTFHTQIYKCQQEIIAILNKHGNTTRKDILSKFKKRYSEKTIGRALSNLVKEESIKRGNNRGEYILNNSQDIYINGADQMPKQDQVEANSFGQTPLDHVDHNDQANLSLTDEFVRIARQPIAEQIDQMGELDLDSPDHATDPQSQQIDQNVNLDHDDWLVRFKEKLKVLTPQ
jgi:RecA-family ATPase